MNPVYLTFIIFGGVGRAASNITDLTAEEDSLKHEDNFGNETKSLYKDFATWKEQVVYPELFLVLGASTKPTVGRI